jgi:hypothetical protein
VFLTAGVTSPALISIGKMGAFFPYQSFYNNNPKMEKRTAQLRRMSHSEQQSLTFREYRPCGSSRNEK